MATVKAKLGLEFLDYAHHLYRTQSCCDVLLVAEENGSFHVHQMVLAAFSERFRAQLNEDTTRDIYIPGVASDVLEALINFIYSGKLCINKQNAKSLLAAAVQLKISAAVDHIRRTHKKIKRLFDTNSDLEEIITKNSDISAVTLEESSAVDGVGFLLETVAENDSLAEVVAEICEEEGGENEEEKEEDEKRGQDGDEEVPNDAMNDAPENIQETFFEVEEALSEDGQIEQGEGLDEVQEETVSEEVIGVKSRQGESLDELKKETASEEAMEVKSSRKKKGFPCKECDEIFVHRASLKLHLSRHHSPLSACWVKSWNSIDCVRTLALRKSMRKVRSQKQLKLGNNYFCKKCNQYFRYRSMYQRHFNQHLCSVSCPKCQKKFTNHNLLRKHLRKHQQLSQTHSRSCKKCGQSFKWISSLKRHRKQRHHANPNNASLRCRHCKRTFKYIKALETHLRHHGMSAIEVYLEFKNPGLVPNLSNVYPSKGTSRQRQQSLECKLCGRLFTTVYTLNLHSIQKHNSPLFAQKSNNQRTLKWTCTGCEFMSRTASHMTMHMKEFHPEVMFSCSQCKYQTPVKGLFDNHVGTRHDTKSKKGHQCSECNGKFHSAYHLRLHRYNKHNIKHDALKVYTCPAEGCSYTACQRYIVDIHMVKHNTEKNFSCSYCQRKLKTHKNLENHIRKVHERIRPFICELCGASYGGEPELRNHIARHDKSLNCEHCDFITSNKSTLQSHMWSKHKVQLDSEMKIYACDQCDYSTDRMARYKQHLVKHGQDRPVICPVCAKTFKSTHTLRSHVKWVHEEKTLHCDYCDHVTATMTNLREHVRIKHTHSSRKPYKCPYCDQLFGTAGNCRKHVACRHKDQPVDVVTVCEKYPFNSRPQLGGQRNPHRANTIASLEYDIETLMNKDEKKAEELPTGQPSSASSETSYVYALHFAPPPQNQLTSYEQQTDMLLPGDFTLSQQMAAPSNADFQQLYNVVPQHETTQQTL